MNVMNRKLFANRSARRRLANMGGIMTSSPELMQAAQTYQVGGSVGSPTAQKVKTVNKSGFLYDVYTDGRVVSQITGTPLDPSNTLQAALIQEIKASPDVSSSTSPNSGSIIKNEASILSNFPKIPDSREAKDQLFRGELADQMRSGEFSIATPDSQNPMVKLIESGIASLKPDDSSPAKPQYSELPVRGVDTNASRRVNEILSQRRTDLPGVNLPGPSTTYEIDPNAALEAGKSFSVAEQMLGLGFTGGDIDPSALTSEADMGLTSITGEDGEEYFTSPAGSIFKKENGELKSVSGGEAMKVVDIAQRQGKDFSKSPVGEIPFGTRDVDPRTGMVSPDTFKKLSIPIGDLKTPKMITDMFSNTEEEEALGEKVSTAQKPPTKEELSTGEESTEEETTEEVKPGNRGFTPIEDVYRNPTKEQIESVEKKVNEEVEKPDGGNANSVASSALLQSVGVDPSNMGLKERVQSMQEMMSELVGYSDEDEKKEFWLTMAGIGFQIASGQSSKALVNIAEGLAQGAKKFAENQAKRQGRKDKLALTALGEVLADDRATRKFGRDKTLAEIRASGSSSYSTVDRMFKSVLDSSLAGYKTKVEDGLMTNEEAVDKAMKDASTAFPDSQFANTTKLPQEETVDVIQNGETIKVPVSQIPTQQKVLTEEKG